MTDKSSTSYYSHGLDKIYTYETINPSSVRKLKESTAEKEKVCASKTDKEPLALDLFPSPTRIFREKEPIDSLQLSAFAMKAIKSLSIQTAGELRQMILTNKGLLRSIGQSHLDEIEKKIQAFFSPAEQTSENHVDLRSLLRIILAKVPPKEKALIVAICRLKSFFLLPPSEEKEADLSLRRLSPAAQEELVQSFIPKMIDPLHDALSCLATTFIQPLLQKKRGVASEHTIQLALSSSYQVRSFEELRTVNLFLQRLLPPPQKKPYFALPFEYVNDCFICLTKEIAQQVQAVLDEATALLSITKTKPTIREIAHSLWKSEAKRWNPLDESTIEEVLYWSYCPFTNVKEFISHENSQPIPEKDSVPSDVGYTRSLSHVN